jgi:hypothetical protein
MRNQSLSQQRKGPTVYQLKLMGALNRIGVYPELEHEIPNPEHPDFPFRCDLFLKERGIDIELDGQSHKHRQAKDAERDAYLLSVGIKTSRWTNSQVKMDADAIAGLVWAMM